MYLKEYVKRRFIRPMVQNDFNIPSKDIIEKFSVFTYILEFIVSIKLAKEMD
jgi:hypothetical protein